jgi:hypothetical protein
MQKTRSAKPDPLKPPGAFPFWLPGYSTFQLFQPAQQSSLFRLFQAAQHQHRTTAAAPARDGHPFALASSQNGALLCPSEAASVAVSGQQHTQQHHPLLCAHTPHQLPVSCYCAQLVDRQAAGHTSRCPLQWHLRGGHCPGHKPGTAAAAALSGQQRLAPWLLTLPDSRVC